jgi:hypothetical protein
VDEGDLFIFPEDVLADFLANPMATAIIRTYTEEGFIIGADGLSTGNDGRVITKTMQKIFQLGSAPLALSFFGTGRLGVSDDANSHEILFDFISELRREAQATSARRFQDLQNYMTRIAIRVQKRLVAALPRRKGPLPSFPSSEPEDYGKTILIAFLDGYHENRPGRVRLRFCHENNVPFIPHLMTEPLLTNRFTFQGITEVAQMMNERDPRLSHYSGGFENSPFSPRLTKEVVFSRSVIDACGGPEAALIDPERAAAIGGHTHIAVITPDRGFQWAIEPISLRRT